MLALGVVGLAVSVWRVLALGVVGLTVSVWRVLVLDVVGLAVSVWRVFVLDVVGLTVSVCGRVFVLDVVGLAVSVWRTLVDVVPAFPRVDELRVTLSYLWLKLSGVERDMKRFELLSSSLPPKILRLLFLPLEGPILFLCP